MTTLTYQERFKTLQGVFDEFTNRTLFELQSRDHFDELVSPLLIGKESNVFLASSGKKTVIVKIYRVQNCDYKRMFEYIKKDPRYEFLQKHRRQIILAWTQREYKNLLRAQKAQIRVPEPITFMNHILVEEMIGDGEPAPMLKDTKPKEPRKFFDLIIEDIKKLYDEGLIHGDLSPFNILNYHEKPYFIDFSQATLVKTPNSEELLKRDIHNIVRFFSKLGVRENEEQLLNKITQKE
ncbi:MAG: serine protein kinase RIO [Nanoarchaeota archaeon]|nr:serine protein kinase RIO [Nanoarchaeota archaeon]